METDRGQRLADDPPDPAPERRQVIQVKNTIEPLKTMDKPYFWMCFSCGFESNNHLKCPKCEDGVLLPK